MQRTKNVPLCTNWPKLLSSPHKVYLLFFAGDENDARQEKEYIILTIVLIVSTQLIGGTRRYITMFFDYVRELITFAKKITRLFEWEMPIKYANTWNSCL